MALYLVRGTYNAEAVQGIQANGAASRVEATERIVKSLGGTVVCGVAWSMNNLQAVTVIDLPSDAAVASLLTTVTGSGSGPSVEVERLLTAEEVDAGIALSADYLPPGD